MITGFIARMVAQLEKTFFGHRLALLACLSALTAVMAYQATGLRISAGFEKSLPLHHEFIETFNQYRQALFGANRLIVAVHARQGTIWKKDVLTQVLKVTDALTYLPGVDRSSVTSVWTPNVFFTEITDEGFNALPLTGGDVTPDQLPPATIDRIRSRVIAGGYVGSLVAKDETSALITADLNEGAVGDSASLDYLALNRLLESKIRAPFENKDVEVQIIGFAKAVGDISEESSRVLEFVGVAMLLTAAAVYWYCRSASLTILPIVCSLVSLVWQFGTLHWLGFGLDPLAILVPFLVFAIGVSHGVQQINFIVGAVASGAPVETAARASFRGLFIPGSLALLTALVSFVTLVLIPIPMIRELAIAAGIGVGYKVITNLIMLPIVASFIRLPPKYAKQAQKRQRARAKWISSLLSPLLSRTAAPVIALAGVALFGVSLYASQGRHVGSVQAGAAELRPQARFNQDARDVVNRFDVGLDWFTVVFEVRPSAAGQPCTRPDVMLFIDDFEQRMREVPGVISAESVVDVLKATNAGMNEGNPKLAEITRNPNGLGSQIGGAAAQLRGIASADCELQGVHLFLADQKAETLKNVVAAVEAFRRTNTLDGVSIRLASGNAGIQAAVNEVLSDSETPMMLYVYGAIVLLVSLVYLDWRAVIACCVPLTVATWLGYWFMKGMNIGLTVGTLPVMVLATGIGVDYAFYIYSRLQTNLSRGAAMIPALKKTMTDTGVATIFTALTLSIGVATWSFSPLQFQADMGLLLTFMFVVNMFTAIILLPAFAIVLDMIAPRRSGHGSSFLGQH